MSLVIYNGDILPIAETIQLLVESETGAVGVVPHVEHGPHMFKGHDMEDIILCIKETTHLLLFGFPKTALFDVLDVIESPEVKMDGFSSVLLKWAPFPSSSLKALRAAKRKLGEERQASMPGEMNKEDADLAPPALLPALLAEGASSLHEADDLGSPSPAVLVPEVYSEADLLQDGNLQSLRMLSPFIASSSSFAHPAGPSEPHGQLQELPFDFDEIWNLLNSRSEQRNESKQLAFRPRPFEAPVISREEVIEIGDSPSPKREEKEVKKKLGKERCTMCKDIVPLENIWHHARKEYLQRWKKCEICGITLRSRGACEWHKMEVHNSSGTRYREPTPTDLQDIVMACFPKYFRPMTEVYRKKK